MAFDASGQIGLPSGLEYEELPANQSGFTFRVVVGYEPALKTLDGYKPQGFALLGGAGVQWFPVMNYEWDSTRGAWQPVGMSVGAEKFAARLGATDYVVEAAAETDGALSAKVFTLAQKFLSATPADNLIMRFDAGKGWRFANWAAKYDYDFLSTAQSANIGEIFVVYESGKLTKGTKGTGWLLNNGDFTRVGTYKCTDAAAHAWEIVK